MPKTYNELYLDARRQLKHSEIEAASLEARELLCYAAGKNRNQFYADAQLYANDGVEERLQELVERRLDGEPTAYLIGEWEFYGLTLDVNRDVLIPRSDTEVIAEWAIEIAKQAGEGCRVLDLCTGSGCIGLAIASQVPGARVVLADINEQALHIARINTRRNGLNRQVMCMQADALQEPRGMTGMFDLIVSNPPYIRSGDLPGLDRSVRDFEPMLALDGGDDGLLFYHSIAEKWKLALKPGGTLLFEVGYDQADDVEQILAHQHYQEIDSRMDTQNIWRAVQGKC